MIGVTTDALTRQLLELGIAELGDPPCPWSWLALGSEARLEQALLTDQDNALVIDPGDLTMEAVDPYFERLANTVNDRLEAAGVPKCHAGVIASNPTWRDTPEGWQERFRRGIELGDWAGGVLGAIGLDLRPVAGPLEVRPMFEEVIRLASRREHFIRRLATTTVKERPPTGFTRTAVIHLKGRTDERLDIKHGGITLITSLARVYAVMGGLSENRTVRRLAAANELGLIEDDTMLGLVEAFRLLWQTRLEHQVRQVRAGSAADDLIDPRSLGPLGRQGLKQAFRMIGRTQDILASRLGLRR
jgi:CBS domain-containing protein